jgi:hypothetical protein
MCIWEHKNIVKHINPKSSNHYWFTHVKTCNKCEANPIRCFFAVGKAVFTQAEIPQHELKRQPLQYFQAGWEQIEHHSLVQ